ncbi:MAG: permease-like cell division protein FtsX [Symbiobacteriaceae bacterium]|nr:permease-like cell division protein FtsX [Symbiobacteriaceae bacterium]
MRPQTIFYFLVETIRSLRRNFWMAVATIMTVSLAMFILGFFAALLFNLDYIAREVESQIEISCYLSDAVTQDKVSELKTRFLQIPGVQRADFYPREEALEVLDALLGAQSTEILSGYRGGNNPLPDAFKIKVSRPDQVEEVATVLQKMSEVEEVIYGHNIVRQLVNLTSIVRIFGVLVMMGLGIAALFIIVNTIRMTVSARSREIEIMRYVGATAFFIRVPFFLEGLVLGLFGSWMAYRLLLSLYANAESYFLHEMLFITLTPAQPLLGTLRLWILASGALFGVLGSMVAMGKYLEA